MKTQGMGSGHYSTWMVVGGNIWQGSTEEVKSTPWVLYILNTSGHSQSRSTNASPLFRSKFSLWFPVRDNWIIANLCRGVHKIHCTTKSGDQGQQHRSGCPKRFLPDHAPERDAGGLPRQAPNCPECPQGGWGYHRKLILPYKVHTCLTWFRLWLPSSGFSEMKQILLMTTQRGIMDGLFI